ncbi:MAG: DNA translocase FtsK 4TM domain-containing protein [Candidatus Krumholzibacteriota bacterium]|nr:DNA translocase FtsK 4TM domain-containing protein [Candidatus Krumholzibacteriota bacterium]
MATRRRIAAGVVLLLCAAFTAVAIASYDPADWGGFWRVSNLCGPIGAYVAGSLRWALGYVFSWIVPVFLAWIAAGAFRGRDLRDDSRPVLCLALLAWIAAGLTAAAGGQSAAGWVGTATHGNLELLAGRIGSVLLLAGAFAVTGLFLFFRSIHDLFARLGSISLPRLRLPSLRRGKADGQPAARKRRKKRAATTAPANEARVAANRDEDAVREPVRIAVSGGAPKPKAAARPRPAAATQADDAPLPDLSLLDPYDESAVRIDRKNLLARSEVIEAKLADYGLRGNVQEVRPGPVVTTFEFVPAAGVKVSQIANRSDDIALALAARAIRIQAPIPGKGAVGIEVPNADPKIVYLKEMLENYPPDADGLVVSLGKTVTGEPYFADIADMPHLLIAGATGSGKSVCINSIICSLLYHHTPRTCRFILVDPKRLELITYNGIPHLLHPVITEAKQTLRVLNWLTIEMDRRYKLLASFGVKNIKSFNRKAARQKLVHPETGEPLTALPYFVTVIDELADLMVTLGNEIYPPITRLSQMARAVGIHLVFATQRPSVDVVTGLIKANFPCRIAFQVTQKTDSRTILDVNGAEKLLGNGDMLYLPKTAPVPIRIQGAFISEGEAVTVAEYWKGFGEKGEKIDLSEESGAGVDDEDADVDDDLFNKAKELVIIHQQGSISLLQRRLRVGYARAARLIDMLEQTGVVGPFEGSKARRVLVRREDYERS